MKSPPTSTRFRLIFYDLDGTLIDSFQDIAAAVNHGYRELGMPAREPEIIKSYVGDGFHKLIERALGPHRERHWEAMFSTVRNHYKEHHGELTKIYSGVPETLAEVRQLGLRQVILTNKPHDIAVHVCRRLDLTDRVDAIQGDEPDRPLKPDPELAREYLRRFGVEAGEAIMVGDLPPDIELGRACGMLTVGCTWGASDAPAMASLKPDRTIHRMEELLDIVKG